MKLEWETDECSVVRAKRFFQNVRILVDLSVRLIVAGKKPSILVYCIPFLLSIQTVYCFYYILNILTTKFKIWGNTNPKFNTQEVYSTAEDKVMLVQDRTGQDRTGPEGSTRPSFRFHDK
jgi:hypothetical protein